MMKIKVVNILTRNDIDFFIPFLVKRAELPEKLLLFFAYAGKIFFYQIHGFNKLMWKIT